MIGDKGENATDKLFHDRNAFQDTSAKCDDIDEPEIMDRLMKRLGVMGRYQIIQIVLVCLSTTLFVLVMLNFVFIGHIPEFSCAKVNETQLLEEHGVVGDEDTKIRYDSCKISVSLNKSGKMQELFSVDCDAGYVYEGGKEVSMATEWDLVCDKRAVIGLIQSVTTLGLAAGVLLFTSLADRFGRRYVYLFDVGALMVTELGLAFAPNIQTAIALRFLTGFTSGGMCLLKCVISAELVITKYRQIFWGVDCIWWSVNVMILAALAFLLQDVSWRYLQLATPILGVHVFLSGFLINETPIWYFAKGRYEEAKRILYKACKMNKKDVNDIMDLFQTCIRHAKAHRGEEEGDIEAKNNYTLLDIFRNRYVLMIVLICGFVWFTNSMAYYGLYLTSSTLAGDRYLNFFLMGLLEIPSSLASMAMVIYIGRRKVTIIFMMMSGVCLLVSSGLVAIGYENDHVANSSTAFFLLGKFAIGASFNVFAAYTPELLVTTFRSVGTGICAMFARVGGILAPFLLPLYELVPWAPGTILTFLCFVCLLLIPLLPETKGRQLPNTIDEIMEWKKTKNTKKGAQKNSIA